MIYNDLLDNDELKRYAHAINNRARTAGKAGVISASELRNRIYASGGQCEWCAESIVRRPFEVDHIISLEGGGSNTADNLAVACPECNRAKSSKHPARFSQETYARTGIMTDLLDYVFNYYGVDGKKQKTLFDELEDSPMVSREEDLRDEPPPYVWGRTDPDRT